jgi:hypothetical protein
MGSLTAFAHIACLGSSLSFSTYGSPRIIRASPFLCPHAWLSFAFQLFRRCFYGSAGKQKNLPTHLWSLSLFTSHLTSFMCAFTPAVLHSLLSCFDCFRYGTQHITPYPRAHTLQQSYTHLHTVCVSTASVSGYVFTITFIKKRKTTTTTTKHFYHNLLLTHR